jgi:hypothetical protein
MARISLAMIITHMMMTEGAVERMSEPASRLRARRIPSPLLRRHAAPASTN